MGVALRNKVNTVEIKHFYLDQYISAIYNLILRRAYECTNDNVYSKKKQKEKEREELMFLMPLYLIDKEIKMNFYLHHGHCIVIYNLLMLYAYAGFLK